VPIGRKPETCDGSTVHVHAFSFAVRAAAAASAPSQQPRRPVAGFGLSATKRNRFPESSESLSGDWHDFITVRPSDSDSTPAYFARVRFKFLVTS
jgi:hypothetical protein